MAGTQAAYLVAGTATVAAAGLTQGTATAIVKQINNVTVGTTNFGVILPIAFGDVVTSPVIIRNTNGGSNNLKVYPPTGGTIDGGSANAAIDVAAGIQVILYATAATTYVSFVGSVTATQSGYLAGLTPGTIAASKAVVVDSNKDAASFRNLAWTGSLTGTSANANALCVGRQGTTTPALNVTGNVSTCVTGLNITARAAAAGVDLDATSSGTDENFRINAKGAGLVNIGSTSTGPVAAGLGSAKGITVGGAKTTVATQNITPTAAQLLGGYISHASTTGAGTNTLPLAADLDTALGAAAVTGACVVCDYANTGTQTVTLTTNTGWTLVGTVAVGSGKNARIIMRRTGSGTWDALQIVSA